MKLKPLLLAAALVALPLVALADDETTTTKTTTTTVNGTVQSYEAGKSVTIVGDNGEATTYTINESSHLPKTVTVGKTVTIHTTTVSGSPVVQNLTYTTTTKTKRKVKY